MFRSETESCQFWQACMPYGWRWCISQELLVVSQQTKKKKKKRALHYISGSISFPKMPQLLADNNTDDSFTVSASYTVRVSADKEKHLYIYKHTQLVLLSVWSDWNKIKVFRFYFTVQTLSNIYLNTLNSFTLWHGLNCYLNLMNKKITTGRIMKGL